MDDLSIAKEIQNQLFHFGKEKVWSWGAHSYEGGENSLQFKVQGYKLKGSVHITLNGSDLYDIVFKNVNGGIVKTLNDIYCDLMVELIDNEVETDIGKYSNE